MSTTHQVPHQKHTDPRPFVRVQVDNDKYFRALVDTGSEVTIISANAFQSLQKVPSMQRALFPVIAANGKPLEVLGSAQLSMSIEGNPDCVRKVLIVKDFHIPFLLGADTLSSEKVIIDMAKRKGQLVGSLAVVHRSRTVTPFTECQIKVETGYCNSTVLMDTFQSYFQPGIYRTDTLGHVYLLYQNNESRPMTVQRSTCIGTCEPIDNQALCIEAISTTKATKNSALKPSTQVSFDHIPEANKREYQQLVDSFPSVFSLNPNDIGHCKAVPHKIILKDESNISSTPPYRTAPALQPLIRDYVDKLYNAGIIQKSTSPFCSPLMLVKKAGSNTSMPLVEQYRVVHDYRKLNNNTVRDCYPLHNLYDLIDKVASAKVWSVIDLSSGFWNQELDPKSRKYTAFAVPGKGHFEYKRTAQGLCNSPAAFQRLLDYVVRGIDGVYVYIDDVVIATKDHVTHLQALKEVLKRFLQYNLKCRPKKVQLGTAEINYLGYNITQTHGIRPGLAKIKSIDNWKPPKDVTEIRQFLGLCSFFRRTIPEFASKAHALTQLTRKDSEWKEGKLPEKAQQAFETLKRELTTRPCLCPPDFTKEFILTVDASTVGLGAILSQRKGDKEYVVAYGSRVLNDTEKKYAPFRLEYLALVWACKHFKPYLTGTRFLVRTDHKPLLSFNKAKGSVYDRYLLELSNFDFEVQYLPGKSMPADALSRQCQALQSIMHQINISWNQLRKLQMQDKELKALAIYLKFKNLPTNEALKQFISKEEKQCTLKEGVLMHGTTAFAPIGLRQHLIQLAHDMPTSGHYSTDKTLLRLNTWYWPHLEQDVRLYCQSCHVCLQTKQTIHKKHPLQRLSPKAIDFNHRVHIDLLGPLPNNQGYKYICVIIDAYSKYMVLAPVQTKEMHEVSQAFYNNWVSLFGPCQVLTSDLGTEFKNTLFNTLSKNFGFIQRFTTPAHPNANGIAERGVQEVLRYIRKYSDQTNEWISLLSNMQLAHNTAVNRMIGYSPYEAVFGRKCTLPTVAPTPLPQYTDNPITSLHRNLDRIRTDIKNTNDRQFQIMKSAFDKDATLELLQPGDKVYVRRGHKGKLFQKFQHSYEGPFTVVEASPIGTIKIRNSKNIVRTVHRTNVRKIPALHAPLSPSTPYMGANNPVAPFSQLPTSPNMDWDNEFLPVPREKPAHAVPSPRTITPTPSSPTSSRNSSNAQDNRPQQQQPHIAPVPIPSSPPLSRPATRSRAGPLPDDILHTYVDERRTAAGNRENATRPNPFSRLRSFLSPSPKKNDTQ